MIRPLMHFALALAAAPAFAAEPPAGFTSLFDGRTLQGWHGLAGNPLSRAEMSAEGLAAARAEATAEARRHWRAEDGVLINDGHGPHLCTDREYGDFELLLDWMITPGADSGIYLRGSPQVQIWDPTSGDAAASVGSGGLYNNQEHPSAPLVVADRAPGEWNTFRIRMIGERVTVHLNDTLVVDDVIMENYWDRGRPLFPREQIELQTHGGEIRFRNLFIREIPYEEARDAIFAGNDDFTPLFNGEDLSGWIGSTDGYFVDDGNLMCNPASGGNLLTEATFDDFILRFEFKLPPGGNNGLAIRAPSEGNLAYEGIELQILDNHAQEYADLQPYQYHGSAYGIFPAYRGYLRPAGEWNFQEVVCVGSRIRVALNGTTITDVDLDQIEHPADGRAHPGMKRTAGHIGFMGHGHRVEFRGIEIRPLEE